MIAIISRILLIIISLLIIPKITSLQFDLTIPNITSSSSFNSTGTGSSLRSLLEQDLRKKTKRVMTANVCIGLPHQCFNLAYDIGIHQTWVVKSDMGKYVQNYYSIEKSITAKNLKGNYHVEEMFGFEVKDQIQFTSSKNVQTMDRLKEGFSIMLIYSNDGNDLDFTYDGALGLNRHYVDGKEIKVEKNRMVYADKKFSVIDYLYSNRYINKRIFSHKMIDKNKGILYIGETGTNETNYKTCNSVTTGAFEKSFYFSFWHCYTSAVYDHETGRKISDIQLEAVFDSNLDYIVMPETIGVALVDYIRSLPDMNECKIVLLYQVGERLVCYNIDITKVHSISFEIAEYNLTLDGSDLFFVETLLNEDDNIISKTYTSNFAYNGYLKHSIVLGTIALMKQQMIFDYENISVGFVPLSDTLIQEIDIPSKTNNDLLKKLMSYYIYLMSIPIILSLIIIFLKRHFIFCKGKFNENKEQEANDYLQH